MTLELELIADKVIKAHQERNGTLDWEDFFYYETASSQLFEKSSEREKHQSIELIKSHLAELNLIELYGAELRNSRLRPAGFKFVSFSAEREKREQKEAQEKDRQKLADEKLKYEVRNIKRIYKTYWLTFFAAMASLAYVTLQIIRSFF